MMKIAIPASGSPALEKVVHGHVASAPVFLIIDLESGDTVEIANTRSQKERPGLNPVSVVKDLKVDALVCAGMGKWAIRLINAAGTKIYLAHGGTVESAIEDFKSGKLRRLSGE